MNFSRAGWATFAGAMWALVACEPRVPTAISEQPCIDACHERLQHHGHDICSDAACERGCSIITDRIAEREQERMLTCMAHANQCSDTEWARCATRIEAHANGGPPAPPPPVDSEDP